MIASELEMLSLTEHTFLVTLGCLFLCPLSLSYHMPHAGSQRPSINSLMKQSKNRPGFWVHGLITGLNRTVGFLSGSHQSRKRLKPRMRFRDYGSGEMTGDLPRLGTALTTRSLSVFTASMIHKYDCNVASFLA